MTRRPLEGAIATGDERAASGDKTILNVLPYYSAETAYEHIAAYTPEAVATYYRILLLDVLLLIPVYVLFFTSGLLHVGGRLFGPRRRLLLVLAVLPSAAAVLNLIEDVVVVKLLTAFPERLDTLAAMCGMLTMTKATLQMGLLLFLAVLYAVLGARQAMRRRRLHTRPA